MTRRAPFVLATLALASWLSVSVVPGVIAAQGGATTIESSGAEACWIEGSLGNVDLNVRLTRGMRRIRLEAAQPVRVRPLRRGVVVVRTIDEPLVEGVSRVTLPFAVGRTVSLREETIVLPRGVPVERLALHPRGPWVDVDLALGDGLYLRRASLPCDAMAVLPGPAETAGVEVTGAESETASLVRSDARGAPLWRARTERLYLFSDPDGEGALRLEVAPESPARFAEIERHGPWVHIAARTSTGVSIEGWVQDRQLVLAR